MSYVIYCLKFCALTDIYTKRFRLRIVLIITQVKNDRFSISSRFPHFLGSRFLRVQFFLGPGFSGSMFFKVRVQSLGPGFRSRLFLEEMDFTVNRESFFCWNKNTQFYSDVLTFFGATKYLIHKMRDKHFLTFSFFL